MTPRTRDWLLQTLGLLVGVIPAILVVFALPLGLICCEVLSIGFVHPRSRPFARPMATLCRCSTGTTSGEDSRSVCHDWTDYAACVDSSAVKGGALVA